MTTTLTNIYPGMLNDQEEFFRTENGVKVISSGSVIAFKDISKSTRDLLDREMMQDVQALKILEQWYPSNKLKQREKFVECRFGGLDHTPDIANNKLQDGEYWECSFRGNCKGEGKVCRSLKFKGQELNSQEIELMKLLSGIATNEAIADTLQISLGLFHKIKQKLYAKLSVQTKQEVALIAMSLNLVHIVSAKH